MVPKDQLQCVLAWSERQGRLRLTGTEMGDIRAQWHIEVGQLGRINQQMMVPGVVNLRACGCYTHAFQAEHDIEGSRHSGAIHRRYDIGLRAICSRTLLHLLGEY